MHDIPIFFFFFYYFKFLIMSTIQHKQDFPIAFAEEKVDSSPNNTTEFYVERLENSEEFPGLSSVAINDHNLTTGNWELLQRKDIFDEDDIHILVPAEEEEEWSTLNAIEKEELYSKIIEKNAQELQPKQYAVQPLWKNEKAKIGTKASNAITDDEDENYEDDLGAELIDVQKSQSRRANKLSSRRRTHDLKTVDVYVKGIYKIATQDGVELPAEAYREIRHRSAVNRSDKVNALVLCSRYSHNFKKRTFKYLAVNTKKSTQETSEYSVHSKIIEKL